MELNAKARKRYRMDDDEIAVLNKLAKVSKMDCWFSIADRRLDIEQKRELDHELGYDRVFDLEVGKCVEARPAIVSFDEGLTDDDLDALSDGERLVYGKLLYRYCIESPNTVCEDIGIFKTKGHSRRCFRWTCMDELAMAFVNKEARDCWERDGKPPFKCMEMGCVDEDRPENMEDFRGDERKFALTEGEFDRISKVFLRCMEMHGGEKA